MYWNLCNTPVVDMNGHNKDKDKDKTQEDSSYHQGLQGGQGVSGVSGVSISADSMNSMNSSRTPATSTVADSMSQDSGLSQGLSMEAPLHELEDGGALGVKDRGK